MKRQLELEAIKEVLVQMAANDELPMDMTQLDMQSVDKRAQEKLKMFDKLKDFTSYDNDRDVLRAIAELERQKSLGNDSDMADYHVSMCESFEYDFTVGELLNYIR